MDAHSGTNAPNKEMPRQGLRFKLPHNETGLNYSSSPIVVFFLVTSSEEASRHEGAAGPVAIKQHGGSKPQQFGPNSASLTKRTSKVLSSRVCDPWSGWRPMDTSSNLLRLPLGKKEIINKDCFKVGSKRHSSANANSSRWWEWYRELGLVQFRYH